MRRLRDDGAHAQRLEDKLSVGIPDINICTAGVETWLEAKVGRVGKRSSTPVRFDYRQNQRLWAHDRIKAGGRVFMIAKIDRQVYLFNYDVQDRPKADLVKSALWIGQNAGVLSALRALEPRFNPEMFGMNEPIF